MLLHLSPLLAPRTPLTLLRQRVGASSRHAARPAARLLRYAALGSAALGASALVRPRVQLEPGPSAPASPTAPPPPALDDSDAAAKPLPPPPESSLAPLELSFGLVCGVCAGVFVKKGAKIIAFSLGGVFVLLQYLSINSVIRVDWQRIGSKFEQLFYRTDPLTGKKKPPTLGSLWNWLVNFLSTDFQPRATFIAGIALGLRIG